MRPSDPRSRSVAVDSRRRLILVLRRRCACWGAAHRGIPVMRFFSLVPHRVKRPRALPRNAGLRRPHSGAGRQAEYHSQLPDPNLGPLFGNRPLSRSVIWPLARPVQERKNRQISPALNRYQPCYERSGMGRIFQMQFPGGLRRSTPPPAPAAGFRPNQRNRLARPPLWGHRPTDGDSGPFPPWPSRGAGQLVAQRSLSACGPPLPAGTD